jgi:hypothetical protein
MKALHKQLNRLISNTDREVLKAAGAVETLAKSHGSDVASRAYAAGVAETLEHEFVASWGVPIVKSNAPRTCVHRLMGKRVCNMNCDYPARDHASMWNWEGKPFLFVNHVYDYDWAGLSKLSEYCREAKLHLHVSFSGSWYFAGQAAMTVVARHDRLDAAREVRKGRSGRSTGAHVNRS